LSRDDFAQRNAQRADQDVLTPAKKIRRGTNTQSFAVRAGKHDASVDALSAGDGGFRTRHSGEITYKP
jgi:hypothetical protein